MKKLLTLAAALMLLLALTACNGNPSPIMAPPQPDIGAGSDAADNDYISDANEEDFGYCEEISDADNGYGYDSGFDPWEDIPVFGSWTGEVVEVNVDDSYPPTYTFLLHTENGSVNFITNFNTFFLGDMPEVGDTITGFHEMQMFMITIYPPQFNASVIVNGEFYNIHVDRFDDELFSYDGSLKLNIGEETEIILQDGQPFDCELAHRKLVVVYDISTRSIPAITTPSQIIVLFEHAVTGPAFL